MMKERLLTSVQRHETDDCVHSTQNDFALHDLFFTEISPRSRRKKDLEKRAESRKRSATAYEHLM
jgi:hypothetical protein